MSEHSDSGQAPQTQAESPASSVSVEQKKETLAHVIETALACAMGSKTICDDEERWARLIDTPIEVATDALITAVRLDQQEQARAEIDRLTAERDDARKGLFHRITGWDKDGQTPDQILDELQQLRNTVALLRSKPEVEALAQGLQDFAYGRVKSLTEMDAITRAELVKSQLTEFTEATNDLLAELERTSTGIPDRVIERLRKAADARLREQENR